MRKPYVDPNYIVSQPLRSHTRRDLKIAWIAIQAFVLVSAILVLSAILVTKGVK